MKRLLLAAVLFLAPAAHAQYAVGASLAAQHIDPASGFNAAPTWLYGPTFSFQHEHGRVFKFGFDLRGSTVGGSGIRVNSVTAGPRLAIAPPHLHVKIYAEVLIGGAGVRPRDGALYITHVDNVFVLGLDHAVARHIDWRVLEYAYSRIVSTSGYADEDIRNQLSTGIVFRF